MVLRWPHYPLENYLEAYITIQLGNHIWATLELVVVNRGNKEHKYYEW